jgi:hypothetical protein
MACQRPVTEDNPNNFTWRNTNYGYTPIVQYTVLDRGPLLPHSAVINNPDQLQMLLTGGLLILVSEDQRLNASELF